jgi:Ca-activated chloride channel family protein
MTAWTDLASGLAALQWAQPLALLLLPLAALPLLSARHARQSEAMPAPQLLHPDLHGLLQSPPPHRKPRLPPVLRALALLAFVLALAQPQREGAWIAAAPEGRDIVVLLDTSLTMSLHDLTWAGKPASRLAVAQRVFADFARARQGDRFALVAFGSHAATLLPPTFDARAAGQMAGLLAVGQLGPDTALGDAIALGLRQVRSELNLSRKRRAAPSFLDPLGGRAGRSPAQGAAHAILILYTDGGVSNTGSISPADAVALARHMGVRIYTVEVGTTPDPGRPYTVPAYAGPQPDLRLIAEATGGRFYFAASAGAQQAAVRDIGALNPRLHPPPTRRAVQTLFLWPLLAGAALWLLAMWAEGIAPRSRK